MAYEYIDKLAEKVKGLSDNELDALASMRQPAAVPGPVKTVPGITKQEELVIEAPAKVNPIEFPEGYNFELKQTAPYVENVNRAIGQREQDKAALSQNAQDAYEQQQKALITYSQAVEDLRKARDPYKTPDWLQDALEKQKVRAENPEKAPERSLLAEAILAFSPGLAALAGGESAALAAPEAQKQGRNLYEVYRKEEVDQIKERNKAIADKYEKLAKLDKAYADRWLNDQKLSTEQARAVIEGLKLPINVAQKDALEMTGQASNIGKEVLTNTMTGAAKAADMESAPEKERQKTKRAGIIAGMKPPSEGERKAAFQYNLTAQAQQNINDVVAKSKGYPSLKESFFKTKKSILTGDTGGTLMNEFMNKFISDPALRSQVQSELQFLESIGRIQSGAAIKPDEWLVLREQYFPSYGDSQDSIALKEKQRAVALEGLKTMAGRADTLKPVSVVPKAGAMSDADKQALAWANKNPKDPRALKIKQKLGVK